jgi:hypothetical protein
MRLVSSITKEYLVEYFMYHYMLGRVLIPSCGLVFPSRAVLLIPSCGLCLSLIFPEIPGRDLGTSDFRPIKQIVPWRRGWISPRTRKCSLHRAPNMNFPVDHSMVVLSNMDFPVNPWLIVFSITIPFLDVLNRMARIRYRR